MKKVVYGLTLAAISLTCGRSIKRLLKNSDVKELSGDWSHQDFIESTEEISDKIGKSDWIYDYKRVNNQIPRIMVDDVVTKIFTKMINGDEITAAIEMSLSRKFRGSMKIIAGGAFRNRIRKERMQQQYHASDATKARIANELGANIILQVTITEDVDQKPAGFLSKKQTYKVYKAMIKAIDVTTSELLWSDMVILKKHIKG